MQLLAALRDMMEYLRRTSQQKPVEKNSHEHESLPLGKLENEGVYQVSRWFDHKGRHYIEGILIGRVEDEKANFVQKIFVSHVKPQQKKRYEYLTIVSPTSEHGLSLKPSRVRAQVVPSPADSTVISLIPVTCTIEYINS